VRWQRSLKRASSAGAEGTAREARAYGIRRILAGARIAIGLLTVIPAGAPPEGEGLGVGAGWFPILGAGIGAAAGAVRLAAAAPLGRTVAAALAVVTLVTVTGALHQDGLADLADALGARGGRDRRLEVMRDSAVGAFGVVALILWAVLLTAVLAALPSHRAIEVLTIACALGRWGAVLHAAALRPARAEGLGASFRPRPAGVLAASALAAATVAPAPGPAAAALGATVATTAAVVWLARRLLGGQTGDTLGASVALTEVVAAAVLLGFAR
jgi:adenosylcobinamide-GDP ribazoletransferase